MNEKTKVYMIKQGNSAEEAETKYYSAETEVHKKYNAKYFHAEVIDSVPITEATITGVTAVSGLEYTGAHQTGYTGISTSEYTGEYVVTYTGTDKAGNSYGPSTEAPVNAGDHTVTFAVPDSNTKYAGSTTVNFSIAQKAVTVTALDKWAVRSPS